MAHTPLQAPEFSDRRGSSLPDPDPQDNAYADERPVRSSHLVPFFCVSQLCLNMLLLPLETGATNSSNVLLSSWICPSPSPTD